MQAFFFFFLSSSTELDLFFFLPFASPSLNLFFFLSLSTSTSSTSSSSGNPAPAYLDGSLPGDYGFDPLRLGSDPELLKWFTHAELIHCRVAMTAVAGILFPAVATKAGAASIPEWFESNKVFQDGATAYPFGE